IVGGVTNMGFNSVERPGKSKKVSVQRACPVGDASPSTNQVSIPNLDKPEKFRQDCMINMILNC
ncbi:MAG: hypothetical protein K8S16_15820, partial [Bacteroidales bacterium]|nr:hypothetical protein [Bacteroidales bacterium]